MSKLSSFLHNLLGTPHDAPPPQDPASQQAVKTAFSLFNQLDGLMKTATPEAKAWIDGLVAARIGPLAIVADPVINTGIDAGEAALEAALKPALDGFQSVLETKLGDHASNVEGILGDGLAELKDLIQGLVQPKAENDPPPPPPPPPPPETVAKTK